MANSAPFPASFPAGLEAIYRTCIKIYDTQLNPIQLSPAVKYWLGGPDPLDFVTVYWSAGDRSRNIPANWHYVSCGLSDLYGDNRTLERCRVPVNLDKDASGFGFELSFRLQCASHDRETVNAADVTAPTQTAQGESHVRKPPPKWPAALLNSIARYVLQTGTPICAGDEIPWNAPLNKSGLSESDANAGGREQHAEDEAHLESRIRHLLVCEDAQLGNIRTQFGVVRFLQLVGVTDDELFAAQNWTAFGVMDLMRSHDENTAACAASATPSRRATPGSCDTVSKRHDGALFGGAWLVTNVRRRSSLLDVSECKIRLLEAIESDGSNLSGIIVTRLGWTATVVDESATRTRRHFFDVPTSVDCDVQLCSEVELELDSDAARFLPLAIRGRLRHGRHFTLTSVPNQDEAVSVTFVCRSVPVGDGIVDRRRRFAIVNANWLHVYLSSSMFDELLRELAALGIQSTLFAPNATASGAQMHPEVAKQAAANRKRADSLLEKLKRRLGRHSLTDSAPPSPEADRAGDENASDANSAGCASSKSPSEASANGSRERCEADCKAVRKDSSRTRSTGSSTRTCRSGTGTGTGTSTGTGTTGTGTGTGTATSNSKRSGERGQPPKATQPSVPTGISMATRVLSWPHYGIRIRINC